MHHAAQEAHASAQKSSPISQFSYDLAFRESLNFSSLP